MKKSLLVRAGAIVMMLVATFFLLVPDMVRAGGDAAGEPSTEVTAETPAGEPEQPAAKPETPSEPATEQPSTEPAEPEQPTTEQPEQEPETPSEPSTEQPATEQPSTEQPATETPSTEQPATEQPSTEQPATEQPAAEQPVEETPSTEQTATETPAAEDTAQNTEEVQKRLAELRKGLDADVSTRTVTPISNDKLVIGSDATDGFIIEGTTITGYQGIGGHIIIPEGITTIGDNAFTDNRKFCI